MPRWVFIPHKQKGLVLAFPLVLGKTTHASIRAPVRMPLKSYLIKRSGYQAHYQVAHDALLNHAPTGYSSDKN